MNKLFRASLVGVATLMALSLAVPGHASEAGTVLTDSQVAALSPTDQAARLNPLRALAAAAAVVGQGEFAGIYSGREIEAGANTVVIYLTDRSQAARFLAAVRASDGSIDTALARVKQGKYTRQAMHEARDRLVGSKGRLNYRIESISVPPDGSALHLGVAKEEAAKRSASIAAASPRSAAELSGVETVETLTDHAIADASRYKDSPYWIAGAYITDLSNFCTSGVPTRRKSDNRPFLITAAHCFSDGASIFTGWQDGSENRVGYVAARADYWDAIAIDTSSTGLTAGREWDGPTSSSFTLDVTSSAYSGNGDYVCQDGYTSGVICNIKVTVDDIIWTGKNGVDHRGVKGAQVDGGVAVRSGDSGGLVFANTGLTRQARGLVSGVTGGGNEILWTEVTDIYNAFGLQLAPPY